MSRRKQIKLGETELVTNLGAELAVRCGGASLLVQATDTIRAQATKRVALRFIARRIASWDHCKLGETY